MNRQINLAPFTITLSILHVLVFIVSIILNFLASDYASYGRKLGTGSCTQVNYTWKWIVFFVKSFSRNFSWNRFHEFFKSHTSLTTIFGTIFVEGGSIILGFRIKCNESCSRSTIFGSKLAELIKRGIVGFKNGINLDKINWALCLKCGQIEQ